MKTKSYLMSTGEENIEVGKTYYFGELNDDLRRTEIMSKNLRFVSGYRFFEFLNRSIRCKTSFISKTSIK